MTEPADTAGRLLPRDPWSVTLAVWRALFLREAVARLFSRRTAWLWLLGQPLVQIGFFMALYSLARVHSVGGMDSALWIMLGQVGFFMFRRPTTQMASAIEANRSLFAYRQVKPVDTVLVRGALEALLMTVTAMVLMAAAALTGHFFLPEDPLKVLAALAGILLLGIGLGLALSVAAELTAELSQALQLAMLPLSLLSGVVFPMALVPKHVRELLMVNPLAHGIEAIRAGFLPQYHAAPELSLSYLLGSALLCLWLGLALQRRFARKLAAQ